jgi:tetratricopeptide (TPR) repeat protein/DNA-binding SARP family transcriptional activator
VPTSGTYVRLLGSFELDHDGRQVEVGGPVGMAILAALAYPPDTKVLPDQLTAAVWGTPGAVTTDNLYRHVTRLRHALSPIGLGIVGHRPGYRLSVHAEQVDAAQFDELLRTARSLADTDPDHAVDRLVAALELWRGPRALDNLTQPGIRRIAAALDARRLDAEEDLADLELQRGRPEIVLDRLYTLIAAHPHRPRLAAALVQALHATGRTDEASSELRKAEEAAGPDRVHPALAQARHVVSGGNRRLRPAARLSAVAPFQLPADTVHFTGRSDQLTRLVGLWPTNRGDRDGAVPGTVVISAVAGMAGVGKTALAVHAAHQLAGQFDEGVLFVDLRGFTPGADPVTPEHALDYLLRGLGVPGDQIPPDLDTRAALYRTVLARRRVLIVLDNAVDETQLQPLLPSAPGCWVLITSRRHLAGLDDAVHLSLPVLPTVDAAALFRALVADRATPADAHIIEKIVSLCGHLPLAIRIAAARLRSSRASTPARLLAELAEVLGTGKGLDWLSDGHRAVTAALDVSYRHLTQDQRYAFRLLGLHPGVDIEPYALAALADTTIDHSRRLLDHLHAVSLIDQTDYRRYTLHDLVATYASTLAHHDPEPDQDAALDRLFDHYAYTTSVAMTLAHPWDAAYPWEADQRPRPPATDTPTPSLNDERRALLWLDTELNNILAAAHHAPNHGRPDHTSHQATALHRHFRIRGRHTDAGALHNLALEHSRRTGNRAGEHNALAGLSTIHLWQGRYELSADCDQRALAIAREIGNRTGEQLALHGLGEVHRVQNRFAPATDYLKRALVIAHDTSNRIAEQDLLHNIGALHQSLGRYEEAIDCYERMLAIDRDIGHHSGEQSALQGLGDVQWLQGRHKPAAEIYRQVLAMARDTSNPIREQFALCALGNVHRELADYRSAADYYQQALTIARQTGDRDCQFEAHQGLGRVHHATGHHHEALDHHHTALELATDLGQPTDQARAHDGLARTRHALGDTAHSRHHWHAALDILTNLNLDHTDEPGVTTATIQAYLDHKEAEPSTG